MTEFELPAGFTASGGNCGIKNSKRDLAILFADGPCAMAACLTTNKSRAHSVDRTAHLLKGGRPVRAIVVCSGNANALTGPEGKRDDERMAEAVAKNLDIDPAEVITASTGAIGQRLPLQKIEDGVPALLGSLRTNFESFAESIMTTDRWRKTAVREVFIGGVQVRLVAIAKGAGMIQPSMATMLCFVTTDANVENATLQAMLKEATARTFNQITVDNDMSTNDMVIALASGLAENDKIKGESPHRDILQAALSDLLEEIAISITRDGEGATRVLEIDVENARTIDEARALARGVAGGSLVKAGLFGGDPYIWGRLVAAFGAKAASLNASFDLQKFTLSIQDEVVFRQGAPVAFSENLRQKMSGPDVHVVADLGLGKANGKAWGCDLTYEYVTINADYTTVVGEKPPELEELDPGAKKNLLLEALHYIDGFRGMRAVIKLGGAAMVDRDLEQRFADDVLLLESVGLRPIVVHGGGPEISRTLDQLGHRSEFVDGLRITNDASMNVVEMVLSGSVNQRLVAAINRNGSTKGVGLSGKDGGLIRARKYEGERDLGRVGEVETVNTELIEMLLKDRRIPVISPIGLGADGTAYNINADVVAAELAAALGAEKLIFLSDVPGFLEADKVVPEFTADQLKARIDRGEVQGGMLPKLTAALKSLAAGVQRVHLVDGRVPHNLIAELFTNVGVGTLIRKA